MSDIPSGWYPDPDDAGQRRFWNGAEWTEDRQPLPPTPNAPGGSTPPTSVKSRGLGAARRFLDTARGSELGRTVSQATSVGARRAVDAAKDPERRAAFLATAYPMVEAAADGARVRNKHGKVKTWRVARAALRPQKTVMAAGKAVAVETGGQVRRAGDNAARRSAARATSPTQAEILDEWAKAEEAQDLVSWREGLVRFEAAALDDHQEMRACARLMCQGLKYAPVDPHVLEGFAERTAKTTANVLIAALNGNDQTTWCADDERHVRLALLVARESGIQPRDLGGNGELEALFEDKGNRMLMTASLSPTPWDFSLSTWFGVPAQG